MSAVTMMLLFTYSPTGSAFSMFFLYFSTNGARASAPPSEKQSTPMPRRAAFSNVDGDPAATQIGGGGAGGGVGLVFPRGVLEDFPSLSLNPSRPTPPHPPRGPA